MLLQRDRIAVSGQTFDEAMLLAQHLTTIDVDSSSAIANYYGGNEIAKAYSAGIRSPELGRPEVFRTGREIGYVLSGHAYIPTSSVGVVVQSREQPQDFVTHLPLRFRRIDRKQVLPLPVQLEERDLERFQEDPEALHLYAAAMGITHAVQLPTERFSNQ